MLRNLQIWHILWLALTPVLFALFQLSSEPYDEGRVLIDNLFILGGAVWVSCIAVYFVITGKKEDALPNLRHLYRGLLQKIWFLWISNIVGTILVVTIAYNLIFYRSVEFYGNRSFTIILNDIVNNSEKEGVLIGYVQAKTPKSFRLRVGLRHLVVLDPSSKENTVPKNLKVPFIFQYPNKLREEVKFAVGGN